MSAVTTPTGAMAYGATPANFSDRLGFKGWGLLLLLPYVVVFALFVVYPVLYGFWLGSNPAIYAQLFKDPAFWTAYTNTMVFLLVAVNLKFVLALLLSGFFVVQRPWIQVMLVIFILPWAMPSIPTILSFRFMLNSEWGVINSEYFRWTFQDGPGWLNRPDLAFLWAIIVHIWKSLPFWTLILITGRSPSRRTSTRPLRWTAPAAGSSSATSPGLRSRRSTSPPPCSR